MECGVPFSFEECLRRSLQFDPSTLCSGILIGSKDVGTTEDLNCDHAELGLIDLLVRSLFESDSAFGTVEVLGPAEDISVLPCADHSLEALIRSCIVIGRYGTNIRVYRTEEMTGECMQCDNPKNETSLYERVRGSIVSINGVNMIRVERAETGPSFDSMNCSMGDTSAITTQTLLMGCLDYDETTGTWFWKALAL